MASAVSTSDLNLLGKVLSQHSGARERSAYAARRMELKRVESELLTHLVRAFTVETVRELGYDVMEARDDRAQWKTRPGRAADH